MVVVVRWRVRIAAVVDKRQLVVVVAESTDKAVVSGKDDDGDIVGSQGDALPVAIVAVAQWSRI